jgi:hypothetical protein
MHHMSGAKSLGLYNARSNLNAITTVGYDQSLYTTVSGSVYANVF